MQSAPLHCDSPCIFLPLPVSLSRKPALNEKTKQTAAGLGRLSEFTLFCPMRLCIRTLLSVFRRHPRDVPESG